jgi:hypothetical protein
MEFKFTVLLAILKRSFRNEYLHFHKQAWWGPSTTLLTACENSRLYHMYATDDFHDYAVYNYDYEPFVRDMAWIVVLTKFISGITYFSLSFQFKIRPIYIYIYIFFFFNFVCDFMPHTSQYSKICWVHWAESFSGSQQSLSYLIWKILRNTKFHYSFTRAHHWPLSWTRFSPYHLILFL